MQTLLWPSELRGTDDIAVQHTEPPRHQELQMARSLMDAITEDFRLEDQHDAYRHALEQVVAARLEGQEPPHAPATMPVEPVDLMAALEQSVKAAKTGRPAPAAKKRLRGSDPSGG